MELKQEMDNYVEAKPAIWTELQYNLNVELPSYLINLLTLVGFDNALSLKLMTPADINNVEKMVQTTIKDLVEQDTLGDYVGIYKNHPEKFTILPGHRKLLDTIISFLNETPTSTIGGYDKAEMSVAPPSSLQPPPTPSHYESLHHKRRDDEMSDNLLKRARRKSSRPALVQNVEEIDVEGIREQLESMLRRWLASCEDSFEIPYTLDNLKIKVEIPEAVIDGQVAYGEPVASIGCVICNSTVRIQSMASRVGVFASPAKRWVLSNFQRHAKRAHFKPELRPLPEQSSYTN